MTRTAIVLKQIASDREVPSGPAWRGPQGSGDGVSAAPALLVAPAIYRAMTGDTVASAGSAEPDRERRSAPERWRHPAAGISALGEALIDRLLQRLRMHRDHRLLMQMNERHLADIGLSRDQLRSLFRQGRDGAWERR